MKDEVRIQQLISTFGIGSIQSFARDKSMMLLGLDYWDIIYKMIQRRNKDHYQKHIITEPRLAKRLGVSHFRKPIISESRIPYATMPYYRFPLWHWCPTCGYMTELMQWQRDDPEKTTCPGIFDDKRGKKCKNIPEKRRNHLIPSRFILTCPEGHIDDFPFMSWVLRNKNIDEKAENLQFRIETNQISTALSAVSIKCYKKNNLKRHIAFESLKDAYRLINDRKGPRIFNCTGKKPWLGHVKGKEFNKDSDCDDCDEKFFFTMTNALNVHSPIIVSSISTIAEESIPKELTDIASSMLTMWNSDRESALNAIKSILSTTAPDEEIDDSTIEKAMDEAAEEENNISNEILFRNDEYSLLKDGGGSKDNDDFFAVASHASFENKELKKIFSTISQVHKLTETRAFAGFKRLVGGELNLILDTMDETETINKVKKRLAIDDKILKNWLPAYQNKGEGIFLEFNKKYLEKWASKKSVKEQIKKLENYYNENRIARDPQKEEIQLNPHYLAIHSFSHILIEKLSYYAGYGASSIREKIYTPTRIGNKTDMNGVLIYTTGEGDGSLGGLCSLGSAKNLEPVIMEALKKALWCSSDPICIDGEGQGPQRANMAACHNCLLLAETACDNFNSVLDRNLLIDKNIGLFYKALNH